MSIKITKVGMETRMREFNDTVLTPPFSLGEAMNRMYQETWLDSTPIRYEWNDVEIVMRKLPDVRE